MRAWVASLVFIAATMVTGFVITPWILHNLGASRFGLGRTLTESFGYMTLVAQGVTLAMVPPLGSAIGRGDRASLHRTLAAGFRVYLVAAIVFLLVGLALTPVLGRMLHVDAAARPELRAAWLICLACIPLTVLAPMKVLLDLAHKGYVSNLLMAVQGILAAALSVAFVWAGLGVVGLMLAMLITTLGYNVAVTRVALRLNPGLIAETRAAKPTRQDWRALTALAGPTLLAMLGEKVGSLSDSIVLSIIRGTAAASTLFLTQRLANLGQLLLNGISSAIWPSLAEMHARGEHDGFNIRLVEITRLVAVMGVAGLAPVIAYNPHFIARWVGPANDGGRLVVLVASAIAILGGILQITAAALVTTGHVGRLAKAAAVSAVLNLIMSVFLTYRLGVIGPILGTLLTYLAIPIWYGPMQLRRVFGTSLRQLFRAAAVPIACGVPFTLGLIALADSHTPPNWFALLGEMAVAAIAFLIFAIAVILGPGDRELWRARLLAPLMRRWARPAPSPIGDDLPPPDVGTPDAP